MRKRNRSVDCAAAHSKFVAIWNVIKTHTHTHMFVMLAISIRCHRWIRISVCVHCFYLWDYHLFFPFFLSVNTRATSLTLRCDDAITCHQSSCYSDSNRICSFLCLFVYHHNIYRFLCTQIMSVTGKPVESWCWRWCGWTKNLWHWLLYKYIYLLKW